MIDKVGDILGIDNMLKNIDLIILDDINSEYGTSSSFLASAIKYIYDNNLSILITSNMPVKRLYEYIPYYISLNDPFSYNFIVKNYKMESFRKPWIANCIGINNIDSFLSYNGESAIGIIIEDTRDINPIGIIPQKIYPKFILYIDNLNSNIQLKLQEYTKLIDKINYPSSKIKIIGPAEKYIYDSEIKISINKIYDMYVTGIEDFNIVIIYISEKSIGSFNQLINIITKIHDYKIKIIVITDSIIVFKQQILKIIEGDEKNKQRLIDRFRIIFPGIL